MAQKLVETYTLTKQNKILEESAGQYPSYRLKLWNSAFNRNGRNYKNVIPYALKNWKDIWTIGMANHPEDETDIRDTVWNVGDPKLDDDGWLSVKIYPVGEHGEKVIGVLETGGSVSISSVIYGNLDSDNYVIVDDELELARWGDWVSDPSNGLYMNKKGEITRVCQGLEYSNVLETKESIESTILNNKSISEEVDIPNNSVESMEEKVMDDKIQKMAEQSLAINIKGMIKDNLKLEDCATRKSALLETRTYAESLTDKTLCEQIDAELKKCEEEFVALAEKGKKADELEESVKTKDAEIESLKTQLTEKSTHVEDAEKEINKLSEKANHSKNELTEKSNAIEEQLNLISQLYEKSIDENKALKEQLEALSIANDGLTSTVEALEEEVKIVVEKGKEAVKLTESNVTKKVSANTVDVKEYNTLKEQLEEANNTIKVLRRKLLNQVSEQQIETKKPEVIKIPVTEKVETPNVIYDEDAFMEAALSGKVRKASKISEAVKVEQPVSHEDDFMARMLSF